MGREVSKKGRHVKKGGDEGAESRICGVRWGPSTSKGESNGCQTDEDRRVSMFAARLAEEKAEEKKQISRGIHGGNTKEKMRSPF